MRKLYLFLVSILFMSIFFQQTVLNGTMVALYTRFFILGFIVLLYFKLLFKHTLFVFRESILYITVITVYGLILIGLANYDILETFFYIITAILFMSIGSILAHYKLENKFYKFLFMFFSINLFLTMLVYIFNIDFVNQRTMFNRFSSLYYSPTYCALTLSVGAIFFIYKEKKIYNLLALISIAFVFLTGTRSMFIVTLVIVLNKLITTKKIYKVTVILFLIAMYMFFGDLLVELFLSRGQMTSGANISSIEGRWIIFEYMSNLLKNNLDILIWGSTYLSEMDKILPISPDGLDRNIYWHNPFALLFMGGLVIYIIYNLFLIKNIILNYKFSTNRKYKNENYVLILMLLFFLYIESFLEPSLLIGTFTHSLFFIIYGITLRKRRRI